MVSANGTPQQGGWRLLLAGLQAGTLGVMTLLSWMGLSAAWQRRSFWTAANLMASTFYGDAAIHSGFARSTFSGLALYFVLYGLVGVLFAAVLSKRMRGPQLLLAGIACGLCWYYLSFGLLWKKISPLVALLHAERPNLVGHILYGGILGQFPRFLTREK